MRSRLFTLLLLGSVALVFNPPMRACEGGRAPVDQTSVDQLIDAGFRNVLATNDGPLDEWQEAKVRENIRKRIKESIEHDEDDERVFDRDASHYRYAARKYRTASAKREHLGECET